MPRPPNLLFVISDDQSWRDTGIGGERTVRTPAFDRSAREGVRFTHAFCASPSCTPSRSAVLTGRHIWQIGEAGGRYGSLPKKFPVFPHLLQAAHYRTGFARKGWGPGECPAGGLASHPLGREYNEKLLTPRPHPALDARDYAENFHAFLRDRPAGAPFFFWFGATGPHRVYEKGAGRKAGKRLADVTVPPHWPDTAEVRSDLLDYALEIDCFYAQLAQMIAPLETLGELDHTLVVVTGDNGTPFPRAKTTPLRSRRAHTSRGALARPHPRRPRGRRLRKPPRLRTDLPRSRRHRCAGADHRPQPPARADVARRRARRPDARRGLPWP
jgi:uncharacterized sulfatase